MQLKGWITPADSLAQRQLARPAHLARLTALENDGRLLIAGPFPKVDANEPGPAGFSGSLIIAEFDDLRAAQAWAEADPYHTQGVFQAIKVRPFKKVFPE